LARSAAGGFFPSCSCAAQGVAGSKGGMPGVLGMPPVQSMRTLPLLRQSKRERRSVDKGYFHEVMELQKTKGKPYMAMKTVRPADKAETFPDLKAENLMDHEIHLPSALVGKVSLVAISFKQFGFLQLDSWIQPFLDASSAAKKDKKRVSQVIQLSMTEGGIIANLLRGSMVSGLREAIPVERHPNSLVHIGKIHDFCDALRIGNQLVGHVFLVDQKGKVRWSGCGEAEAEELDRLRTALGELQ